MYKASLIIVALGLLIPLAASPQQTGPPAQPGTAIYNRMRRFPSRPTGDDQQSPQVIQTQQFPNRQFPPEQPGQPLQRPGMNFPHASGPPPQPTPPPQPAAQPQPVETKKQQPQEPYGLALQPANPARISYAGGQLTVDANNSSLPDILKEVTHATGAHLQGSLPPDSDRVFGQFGPGTVRDVLNSMLSGSSFDYILVGGIDDPGNVQEVMLTPHGGATEGASTASNQRNSVSPPQEDEEETNEPAVVQPAVVEPPPPPPNTAPEQQTQPGQMQVKTPEQLLQELQRLRQQQQQQQQPQAPR